MKAIFISSLDFESPIQVGDHQLAKQFLKNGWDLAFISLAITPFHMFSRNKADVSRRYKNYKNGGITHTISNNKLWSYVPGGFINPKISLSFRLNFLQSWQKFTFPNLKRLIKDKGFDQVELLYIRDPYQISIMDLVEYDFSIFRVADNDEKFDPGQSNYKLLETSLVQKVDLVLYTAQNLENKITSLKPKSSLYFPNGVNFNFFQSANQTNPDEYKNINKPIIVYAGSLDFWFDFSLINQLTCALPEVNFVIIGPNEKFRSKFIERKNLHLLGPRPHQLLSKYLFNADIGIIPFNVAQYPDLVNSINPIKLYEYMACGLPVVSTRWDELNHLNSPAILCSDFEDYKQAIAKTLSTKSDKSKCQAFAAKFDWEVLFQQLIEKIKTSV